MSTSILDYTFRELAISYLDRHDLGHITKNDLDFDTTGGGEKQTEVVNRVTSRGFIRKQGLVVYSNESSALKAIDINTEEMKSTEIPTMEVTNQNQYEEVKTNHVISNQIEKAKMQGFEGEPCPECQNFTLIRNGTCLKCNTCGSTTGCS